MEFSFKKGKAILAHISDDRQQTLEEHSTETEFLCKNFGSKIGLGNTAGLIGKLHDMGKAASIFQKYIRGETSLVRGEVNHSAAGGRYIYSLKDLKNPYSQISSLIIAEVIISHHHGLYNIISPDGNDIFRQKLFPKKDINYEEAAGKFFDIEKEDSVRELFMSSTEEIVKFFEKVNMTNINNNEAFTFTAGLTVRYLLSCLLDADRYGTYLFAEDKKNNIDSASYEFWDKLSVSLEKYISGFTADTSINKERMKISNSCLRFSDNGNGIFQLLVPTGGGKTISSIRYAVNCAKKHGKDRIFYIAPYKTILEQNAEKIKTILEDNIGFTLEHHSDVVSDNDKYKLLTERWSSPVILTTMVQFLDTLFAGKSSSIRRFHSLADSVIILDEVQSVPVKCIYMFNTALNFLAEHCGCAVILCTATQPQLHKTKKHPVRLGSPAVMVENTESVFRAFKRTKVHDCTKENEYNADTLSDFIIEKHIKDKRILAVMNTKKAALNLYKQIKKKQPCRKVCYLSTGLCPAHRSSILREIRESEDIICVSTQMIEAGVDISFNSVVRSLAGLDSIAQAAGRCNRNKESKIGDVYIIKNSDENLSRLIDIKEGQKAAVCVLEAFKRNKHRFGNDLLSVEAMNSFYYHYYGMREQKNEMSYLLDKKATGIYKNTSLYDLLAFNKTGREAMQEGSEKYILKQAFESAGKYYASIESEGIGVLVPYGDGEKIISRLCSVTDLSEKIALLRKAQKYSVNIFPYEKEKLEEQKAIYFIENAGVFAVDKSHYDTVCGLEIEKDMEILIK